MTDVGHIDDDREGRACLIEQKQTSAVLMLGNGALESAPLKEIASSVKAWIAVGCEMDNQEADDEYD